MVRTITEATSPGGEGQSTSGPSEEIFRYPYRGLSASLYKTSAAQGQTREAMPHLCRSLHIFPGNRKKCHDPRLTKFYGCTPSV